MTASSSFDARTFRHALGAFATGIAVITTVTGKGQAIGVTVNSFSSVSLDPPLVQFCLGRTAMSLDAFSTAKTFAVNILAADQQDLSIRFSRRDQEERWDGVAFEQWESGAPILKGCLSNLECDREHVYDGGDHVIIIGRVRRLITNDSGSPLLYFRGGYAELG